MDGLIDSTKTFSVKLKSLSGNVFLTHRHMKNERGCFSGEDKDGKSLNCLEGGVAPPGRLATWKASESAKLSTQLAASTQKARAWKKRLLGWKLR